MSTDPHSSLQHQGLVPETKLELPPALAPLVAAERVVYALERTFLVLSVATLVGLSFFQVVMRNLLNFGWEWAAKVSSALIWAEPFLRHLGVRITAIEDGAVETSIEAQRELMQQHGYAHGGVIATLADTTSGLAALTKGDERTEALTVEFKINFLKPAAGTRLRCRSRVIRAGRTLSIMQADVFAGDGATESHVATAMVTFLMWKADGAR